jgi:AraC-like DNA-binding protein
MPARKVHDDDGEVRFHHITPELRVLDARRCARQWVVYHETYAFCLVLGVDGPPEVTWRYNHRRYVADTAHAMVLQPGELHANVTRTPPADFVVVMVNDRLMKRVAAELGWPAEDINFNDPHPGSGDPRLLAALRRFQGSLCRDLFARGGCACWRWLPRHQENLTLLVGAVLQACAERTRRVVLPGRGTAPIIKVIDHLREFYDEPYDLDRLARVAGCKRYYLAHVFTEEIGIPPSEYQNRVLAAKACQVLAACPDKPLAVVAHEVGWPGRAGEDEEPRGRAAILIKHFRRAMGTTPGAFRASLRGLSASERQHFVASAVKLPGPRLRR